MMNNGDSAFTVRVIAGDISKKFLVTADEGLTVADMLRKADVEYRSFDDLDVSMDSQMVINPQERVTYKCTIVVLEHSSNG